MTPEDLQHLIAAGETMNVEFKGGEGEPLSDRGLIEAGMVEARGEKKGRAWHLSAATYRRLGKKAAYIRQRGFEPLQQEQMILQYVEKHGSIKRGEAAELCKIGSMQAYRLLKRLEKHGKIERLGGSTKAVRYGIPSK